MLVVRTAGVPFATLRRTSRRPSPPEAIGLDALSEMRERHGCAIGLSDRSGTVFPALAACAAHAVELVEVHLTMTREMFGPDVAAAVTPAELRLIVDGTRFIGRMRVAPPDRSTPGRS